MRFLKYNEKIILLVLSLLLIGLLTITIYFTMNYEQFNHNIKIAILNTTGPNAIIKELSKRQNIKVISSHHGAIERELGRYRDEYSVFIIVVSKHRIPIVAMRLNPIVNNLAKPVILSEHHHLMNLIKKTRFRNLSEKVYIYNYHNDNKLVTYDSFL